MREASMLLMQIAQRVDHGNKTVRHQNISAPVEKDSSAPRQFGIKTNRYQDKSAPHFLSNKREMQSKHT